MASLLAPVAGSRARPIAADLITRHGTVGAALAAPGAEWERVSADRRVIKHAKMLRRAVLTSTRDDLHDALRLRNTQVVWDYLKARLSHLRREHFIVLFFGHQDRLLSDEVLARGTVSAVKVDPRILFARALALDATRIIIAHNHPSGETDPSNDDLAITRRVAATGQALGVELIDHIIVTMWGMTSLRAKGII